MPPVYYHEGKFPPDERLDWSKLIPLIGRAAAAVARYDGLLGATPNPDVLLAPLTTREAVLSSRIEGTQATMGEVLEYEAGREPDSPARREDIHVVLNYRSAMRLAAMPITTGCSPFPATTTGQDGVDSSWRRCRFRPRTTWPRRRASLTSTTA